MSTESQFRAALQAHAPLVAIVGARIALNAVPEGADLPLVVFGVDQQPIATLAGEGEEDQAVVVAQCWAVDGDAARALAQQVKAAVGTAPPERCAAITTDRTLYDEGIDAHGVELTIDWFP